MMNQLRPIAEQLSSRRALVVAMLLGPLFGTALAFRTIAAEGPSEIKIDNFSFGPKELTVEAGTTVTWVNRDDIPHSVVDKAKAFRSKTLDTNNSFSFIFANAGTYEYICGLHPQMTGKVIVK